MFKTNNIDNQWSDEEDGGVAGDDEEEEDVEEGRCRAEDEDRLLASCSRI